MMLPHTLYQSLLQLCLLLQLASLSVTQPPRNDADYEYNTEANNKPHPSPITPGIQPSTVYTIHALPPDPPPAPDGGARVSTTTATTPPLYSDHPPRGGSHPYDLHSTHFQNTDDVNYDSEDYDPSYDYSYDDYYPGEGAASATSSLERNLLSAPVKTVEEGSLLRLKCKLVGLRNNESVTVSWYLNDTEITELSAHRRLKFLPYKTPPRLRISRIRMTDAGLYSGLWMSTSESQRGWCNQTVRVVLPAPRHPSPLPLQARNKVQDDSDYGDEVNSLAPVFSKHLQSILVKPAGNVAELRCPAKGENLVTRWEKDGQTPKRKIGEIRMRKNMLKMENLVPLDSGNYTCIVSNEHGSINHTFNVDVIERLASRPILKQNLQNQTVVMGTNATLECSVISDQPPFISWLKHPTQDSALDHAGKINQIYVIKEGGHRVTTEDPQVLVLSNVSDTDEGWYTCLAANSIGTSYSTAYLTVATEELNPNDSPDSVLASPPGVPSYVLFIAVSVLLLVLLSACAASCCAVNKWKQEKRRSLELERERSNNTFSQHIKKVIVERHENEHSEEPLLVPSIKIERRPYRRCLSSNESHTMSEYELPLDSAWELSRDRLVLSDTLGEGAFGKVLKAELCSPDKKVTNTVAVKMLKEGHTDSELMDLVSEMEMMKIIGTHQNIINLIGCCTQEGPLFVVVEFAHHGNLRDFLRSSQPSALGYECAIDHDPKSTLTQRDLLGFAYQVARGMDYLAAKKCVHRDLAARNVLVCQERILKIADFGLARDIHSQDYYRKTSEGRLPIKWMAPEALFSRMYTTASDVWAFGILLWEIMSLGGTPYPSVPSVQNLFNLLREGHRMLKPHHCSMETYVLMKECWRYNAGDRPTFRDILNELSRQLSMVTNEEYLDLTVSAHLDTPPSSYDSGVTSVMLPQQI